MRVLLTTIPGFGHLCPILPFALALKKAGHDVALASSSAISPYIEPLGIELLSCGPVWLESEFSHDRPSKELQGSQRYGMTAFIENDVFPNTLSDLLLHVNKWRPDVIMSNDYEMAGRIIAEILQIPFVLMSSGPRLSRELRTQWHAPIAKKPRIHAGLDSRKALDYALHWLHLCFTPEWYVFKSSDSYRPEDNEYGIRPEIYDCFPSWTSNQPINLATGNEKPNVLCTLGTVFNKDAEFLHSIVEATKDAVGGFYIFDGPCITESMRAELPTQVVVLGQTPLSNIISMFDYCICHGGTSTFTTILTNGVPSLLLPQGADQEINAIACNQHKLGIALLKWGASSQRNSHLVHGGQTAWISDGFGALVSDSEIEEKCINYKESCDKLLHYEQAIELVERLVATGRPVV